jgi:hypothetical protein
MVHFCRHRQECPGLERLPRASCRTCRPCRLTMSVLRFWGRVPRLLRLMRYTDAIKRKANLLNDGVADTLELVGVMSGIRTAVSISASDRRAIPAASSRTSLSNKRDEASASLFCGKPWSKRSTACQIARPTRSWRSLPPAPTGFTSWSPGQSRCQGTARRNRRVASAAETARFRG